MLSFQRNIFVVFAFTLGTQMSMCKCPEFIGEIPGDEVKTLLRRTPAINTGMRCLRALLGGRGEHQVDNSQALGFVRPNG